jgi:hypothetical protein
MEVDQDRVRAVIREVLARLDGAEVVHREAGAPPMPPAPRSDPPASRHASAWLLVLPAGSETGGACLIEPLVRCTHCGYCRSYGH